MSPSAALLPPVRTALHALIDYAGLFPPAMLSMAEAIDEYAALRAGSHAWMLGRFIVPASRIADLGDRAHDFALSVILDAEREPRRWFDSLQERIARTSAARAGGARVGALEVPLAPLAAQRETYDAAIGQLGALLARRELDGLPAFAELPYDARWRDALTGAMSAAARSGIGVKIRCGGITEAAFPPNADVAAFIEAAVQAGVPFKATAGLHHPIRHRDASTGFPMHGFLNVLAAAALASRVESETLDLVIAEEDAAAFAFDANGLRWRDLRIDAGDLANARAARFVGYGSCSVREPVDDLIAMGVLP